MEATMERAVVVGYDGSETSDAALAWALAEAEMRGRPVRLVVAVPPWYQPGPLAGLLAVRQDDFGRQLAEQGMQLAKAISPDVPVRPWVLLGGPAGVLVTTSRGADLVVVGRGRHRAVGEAIAGSTSTQVIAHAHCPVAVVEAGQRHGAGGSIVVGYDGSTESQAAMAVAFDAASLQDAAVQVVRAWWVDYFPEAYGQAGLDTTAIERIRADEDTHLAEAVAAWSGKHPEVTVTGTLLNDAPVDAILTAAQSARLIVVGSRGHGGFAGLLLGSVSQGLLHRTRRCPLLVVHH